MSRPDQPVQSFDVAKFNSFRGVAGVRVYLNLGLVSSRLPTSMLSGEPILVLGVFRSGTSCLSTALDKLGVFLGDERDFYPPNENNLGGYYEIRQLQALNLQGYSAFGMSFYRPDRLPAQWEEVPGGLAFMEEVRKLLLSKFSGKTVWGFKEPGMTGLIPIYNRLFANEGVKPRYVICVRHPLSVAGSQIARQKKWGLTLAADRIEGLEPPIGEHTLGLWLHYTLSAIREARGHIREVFSYEDVLSNPEANIRRLATRVMPSPPSEDNLRAAIETVRPDWSHNKYSMKDLEEWPTLIARTYECCLRIASDSTGFNEGKYDGEIDELWDEFVLMGKMILPIQYPAGQMLFSWRDGQKTDSHSEKYSPTGNWQAISASFQAPPNSMVQIDPYQMPCQIWLRRAVWKTSQGQIPAQMAAGPNGVLEDVFGLKRLTVFGPGPLVTRTPADSSGRQLELEFLVQSGQPFSMNIINVLRGGIEQVRRAQVSGSQTIRM